MRRSQAKILMDSSPSATSSASSADLPGLGPSPQPQAAASTDRFDRSLQALRGSSETLRRESSGGAASSVASTERRRRRSDDGARSSSSSSVASAASSDADASERGGRNGSRASRGEQLEMGADPRVESSDEELPFDFPDERSPDGIRAARSREASELMQRVGQPDPCRRSLDDPREQDVAEAESRDKAEVEAELRDQDEAQLLSKERAEAEVDAAQPVGRVIVQQPLSGIEADRQRHEAEERRRREEEAALLLQEQERNFWASMPPADAEKMRAMLQAVSLCQKQLQHNEQIITNLHDHTASKERTYRGLRRRAQQAEQGLVLVQDQDAHFEEEVERWTSNLERYNAQKIDIVALRARRGSLQEERRTLSEELTVTRSELVGLRDRLGACEAMSEEQSSRLVALEAHCGQTVDSVKSQHADKLFALREEHAADIARQEEELDYRVEDLKIQRAAEAQRLQAELGHFQQQGERAALDRQEAMEDLQEQQREGSRLQQQCADAREEVLDLASQVRAYQEEPRVAAQLGVSLDGSMASISFLPLPGDDPQLDAELDAARRQCKALERECQRTHATLEKKQAECERWRARILERRRRGGLPSTLEEPLGDSEQQPASAPFLLGDADGDAVNSTGFVF